MKFKELEYAMLYAGFGEHDNHKIRFYNHIDTEGTVLAHSIIHTPASTPPPIPIGAKYVSPNDVTYQCIGHAPNGDPIWTIDFTAPYPEQSPQATTDDKEPVNKSDTVTKAKPPSCRQWDHKWKLYESLISRDANFEYCEICDDKRKPEEKVPFDATF